MLDVNAVLAVSKVIFKTSYRLGSVSFKVNFSVRLLLSVNFDTRHDRWGANAPPGNSRWIQQRLEVSAARPAAVHSVIFPFVSSG